MGRLASRLLLAACLVAFSGATFSGATFSGTAYAQDFPTKQVNLLLPYPAGGSSDFLARLVAEKASELLGRRIVVENRVGANGMLAMEAVANAEPNGHTLLFGVTSLVAMNPHILSMRIDPLRQLAPIAQLANGEFVLVAARNTPVNSAAELVAHAKAQPGQNFASSGTGSHAHIAMEMFARMAGVKFTHVPYKGGAPALTDLLGGHISYLIDGASTVLPHSQSGAIKALGVTSAKRWPTLPDMPAISETLPGYDSIPWYGLFATAGTPPEILARLNKLFVEAVNAPDVRAKMRDNGYEVATGSIAEFTALVRADYDRYGKIIGELGLKTQ
ncbi:MAG: tripartite tricarboxylate transporter substrate binding protein [Variibacter sp.]|nr:tripartite tricarboxylate transporter substrate binding protein [Variibacter sp.]